MFIFRPSENDKRFDVNDNRYIKIAKQKNGPRTTLVASFDGAHQKFAMIDFQHTEGSKAMRGFVDKGNFVKQQRRAHSDGQLRLEELPPDTEAPF